MYNIFSMHLNGCVFMKANEFFRTIEDIFLRSLKDELDLSPKPGCVDGLDSGPHTDMDYDVFLRSISSLKDYFFEVMMVSNVAKNFSEIFELIRPIGIKYEEKMYRATGGVNTHKGAIFMLGVIASAVGKLYYDNKYITIDLISEYAKKLCANIFDDFKRTDMQDSNGARIYKKNDKHSGIRNEAYNGFSTALDAYRFYNDTKDFLKTYLYIISTLDDTTTINRVGERGLDFSKDYAKKVLKSDNFNEDLSAMNMLYTKKNISTGGCADTIELVYFFKYMDDFINSYINDFLNNKEVRWSKITQAIHDYEKAVITVNLNIKGMHKDKDEFEPIYKAAKTYLESYECIYEDEDTYTAIYLAKDAAIDEKKKFVCLEERHDFMRFVDIDVVDINLNPISRTELGFNCRTCIICGGDRFTCIREERHTQEDYNACLNKALLKLDK